MTIKEFAKSHGVTVQAVYSRIKAEGINLQDIKRENSPELTEAGLDALSAMFNSGAGEASRTIAVLKASLKETLKQLENQSTELDNIKADAEALKGELDEQKRLTEHWKTVAELAQEQADKWSAALKEAQLTAQQAQMLHLAAYKALPAAASDNPGGRKLSLWERITGRTAAVNPAAAADPDGDPRSDPPGRC